MDQEVIRKASRSLMWYFRMLATASGINWDSDNEIEIEDLVEDIIKAAVEETMRRINEAKDS